MNSSSHDEPFEDTQQIDDPAADVASEGRASRWALPRRYRWPAAISLVTAAAAIAIVASTLPWQSGPDRAATSVAPAASAEASDPVVEPSATATDRPPALAYAAVADLTAGSSVGGVVALDSDFRLASLDGSSASELASRISIEPALEFTIEPEPDGASVRLRPAKPLQPGVVYRFSLATSDGHPLDSWAFQAKQAVQVVSTVPGDTTTDVPLNTGIEITFDQDGVVDPAAHVTITPKTTGRFEHRGRTLAFIPNRLKAATVYSVTVSRGVRVQGTDEVLAEDFRFRFETAAKAGTREPTFEFPNELLEVGVAGRPDLPIWGFNENGSYPKTARIEVYRLAGIGPAIDAYRLLRGSARWARWSTDDSVSTTGLRRVMAFDAKLWRGSDQLWFRLPDTLTAGWYLVQQPSPKGSAQMILQVTDVAGYLTVSDSRTLVWANDLANGRAIVGARVSVEGAELGRTDADGLLLTNTPARLLVDRPSDGATGTDPIVTVRTGDGRSMFMPSVSREFAWLDYGGSERSEAHWLVYHTDRLIYRRTDTVNVWGVIRERAAGAIPENVEVLLVTNAGDPLPPAIATLHARPGPAGAFTGSLELRDLPEGSYDLVLRVGSTVVGSTSIQVDRILKPAYRLEVETGRRVYIQGDRIRITSRASFYEGSPVPGVPLRIGGSLERNVRTDATGTAVYRTTARVPEYEGYDGWFDYQSISVSPARAEEGEISGASREFIVFPSTRMIKAEATIQGGRVRLRGKVHLVERDRLETELAAGASPYDLDPRGKPVGGATVTMTFIEYIPSRVKTGTTYDWIEKQVVPVYEYRTNSIALRTIKVRTAADGSFASSVRDSGHKHDYSIKVSVPDPDGHTARTNTWASGGRIADGDTSDGASLEPTSKAVERPEGYAIGEAIDLTFRENRPVSGGRYLFHFAQRGLRDATVQRSPRLQTQFRAWAMPNMSISGVHFTGRRYVVTGDQQVAFRAADRALDVGLTTTRTRYAPGEQVTLDVRTRDRAGKPVAAAVVVNAVDVKLYAIGAASETEPLRELYASISSGIRTSFVSHRAQGTNYGEGGDTTGGGGDGGPRFDFRDAVLFEVVQTGADGRGRTTFRLSDDLTSWRVTGAAITADMKAGSDFIDVPVGLPFFVDAAIAPEYLAGDQPSIQVRAYGSALKAGSDVRITVASDSLGLASRTLKAKAFATVTVALPKLTAGLHTVTVSATSGAGASTMTDRLTRSFTVIASRFEQTKTQYLDSFGAEPIPGGAGLTSILISDTGAGRYLPVLLEVSGGDGARLERAVARAMASGLLARHYGGAAGVGRAGDFDGGQYQTPDGGIAPVPYASSDVELSALVAIFAPDRFRAEDLRGYLDGILANPKSTRERRTYAIAGLAGLGAPVLPQIRAAALDTKLTIRERLVTGLGASAIGDAATARSIAGSLWSEHGEQLADVARLRVGESTREITAATSLMAVLAAGIGDTRAPALWAYVEANPNNDAPYELFAVAYVDRILDRLRVEPASFAYVVDGSRTQVDLEAGDTFQLTLTAAQRQGLRIETLKGSIGLTTTWREPVGASTIKKDPDISVRRSRTPAAIVRTSDLVRIDLTVTFGPKAPAGCHLVTELVPSGLIPMGPMSSWYEGEDGVSAAGVTSPFSIVGQRVMFCAEPTKKVRTVKLRYYARVITPGRFVWEPAVVESRTVAGRAAMTPVAAIRIR